MTDMFDDTPETEAGWERRQPVPDEVEPRQRRTDGDLRGRYRALRAQFLKRCAVARRECYFGDGAIDYRLPHGSPMAATVHHTVPIAAAGGADLEMEVSLWAPSHARCNKLGEAAFSAGGGVAPGSERDGLGIASEKW
ncbi:MAG: hypothetical protein JO044_12940 [Mycobacteriaceae bacterium]|nr:hypothetical protein [Mycobacteriaceae bacterium]